MYSRVQFLSTPAVVIVKARHVSKLGKYNVGAWDEGLYLDPVPLS
jgi:hypothetical protein